MSASGHGARNKRAHANAEAEAVLLAESLRDVVSRFVKTVREHSGTQTNAQQETLALLERTGPASIAALAERRGVTHQTMRLIVMKLVEQGLLIAQPDTADKRAYVVQVTDAGRAQLAGERAARAQWLAGKLLNETDAEERALLKAAIRTLDKLIG